MSATGPIADPTPASPAKEEEEEEESGRAHEERRDGQKEDDDDDSRHDGDAQKTSPTVGVSAPRLLEAADQLTGRQPGTTHDGDASPSASTSQKLDAMSHDREALRTEVHTLRRQLETLQQAHAEEVALLQAEADESNAARETAEEQYQNLMGRVEKIKETLSERLRRDRLELDEAKERVDELEGEAETLRARAAEAEDELATTRTELADSARELASLRSRNNLSAQNWLREKDDLTTAVARLRAEVETTSNAMGEWEVIAMEERSVKDGLADKLADMQRELGDARAGHDTAARERDSLAVAVDRLQRSLHEIQDARKRELREMVESHQDESRMLKDMVRKADARAAAAEAVRDTMAKDLERAAGFEDAVKEKNLLIGKLRHEAIVLNEHLTKALRYLKKTKPEDNVDR
jgi:chromosome segregation ATPase